MTINGVIALLWWPSSLDSITSFLFPHNDVVHSLLGLRKLSLSSLFVKPLWTAPLFCLTSLLNTYSNDLCGGWDQRGTESQYELVRLFRTAGDRGQVSLTCEVTVKLAAPTMLLHFSYGYYGIGADRLRNTRVFLFIFHYFTTHSTSSFEILANHKL